MEGRLGRLIDKVKRQDTSNTTWHDVEGRLPQAREAMSAARASYEAGRGDILNEDGSLTSVNTPNRGIDWIEVNWGIPQRASQLTEGEVEVLFEAASDMVGQTTLPWDGESDMEIRRANPPVPAALKSHFR